MIVALVGSLGLGAVGCSSQPAAEPEAQTQQAPAQSESQEQRYDLRGTVVSVDPDAMRVVVNHEAIPGFMGAMTMGYPVHDAQELANLKEGEKVTATVVSMGGGEYWLEHIMMAPEQPAAQ